MILAIDCDLRQSYCVSDAGYSGRGPDPWSTFPRNYPVGVTVLFEIASPVSFNRGAAGHAAMTQLAKWAIWNSVWAAKIDGILGDSARLLVSPSNVWTKGFELKTRHAMAKCKQPKKDLRECECMIFMYKHCPELWKSLPDYLASL